MISELNSEFDSWTNQSIKTAFDEYVKGSGWDVSSFNSRERDLFYALQMTFNISKTLRYGPIRTVVLGTQVLTNLVKIRVLLSAIYTHTYRFFREDQNETNISAGL